MFRPFDSKEYRKRTMVALSGDECCICGRHTSGRKALHVPVDHERNEFVTSDEAASRGDAVSLYPIGPECARTWKRAFGGEAAKLIAVERRIAPELVYINGEPCTKTVARKETTCIHSRKIIKPGDAVYRPLSNSSARSARYLAAEIEANELNK